MFETQDVHVNDGGTFEISEEKTRTPGTGICIFILLLTTAIPT